MRFKQRIFVLIYFRLSPSFARHSSDGQATRAIHVVNLTITCGAVFRYLRLVVIAMSIVEELRQNDPARKSIRIHLMLESSDAALAQALEQNPFVTDIVVGLQQGVQQTDWDSFLRVIATRAKLETVRLLDAVDPEERTAPVGLVRSILQAIQQNTSIQSVELWWLRIPTEISTFVNTASSVTTFSLSHCEMDPADREQGARDLAAALQRSTSIQSLKICELDGIFTIPILEGLRSNISVKTLIFTAMAFNEETFRPVAQSLIQSQTVCELKFKACLFHSENIIAQFQSVLQNKRNLTSLCLQHCNFGGVQVHEDIISVISWPGSVLRCFEFSSANLQQMLPNIPFEALLRAIEKSKLERFSIGRIETPYQLQTLMQSIPSMRIRELDVVFDRQVLPENANPRQNLLLAVKKNFSLRSVKGKHLHGTDFFDNDDDKQRLALYAIRNKSLDQWVDNPEKVEQSKVWPEALHLAQKAGPNALFRGLHSVLERDYVSLPGGRKRKRPQYYTPT